MISLSVPNFHADRAIYKSFLHFASRSPVARFFETAQVSQYQGSKKMSHPGTAKADDCPVEEMS